MTARPPVLIVGATGGVGRHVAAAFRALGHPVHGVARRPAPGLALAEFLPLDVSAAGVAELAELLRRLGTGVVVNAADGWRDGPEALAGTHIRLVEQLLAAGAELPVPPRFVQVGTVHEYGVPAPGRALTEDSPERPESAYARSRLAGSRAVLRAVAAGRVSGLVLRVVNVCGPGSAGTSFLGTLVRRLREGRAHELVAGAARRDYLDIRDVAEAVVRAARSPVSGVVVNLGRGRAVPVRELVSTLLTCAGQPVDTVPCAPPDPDRDGPDLWVDPGRAQQLLGWRARIGLVQSLRDMWAATADGPPNTFSSALIDS